MSDTTRPAVQAGAHNRGGERGESARVMTDREQAIEKVQNLVAKRLGPILRRCVGVQSAQAIALLELGEVADAGGASISSRPPPRVPAC